MSEQDAERFRARGFGLRLGWGQRPALVVVDLLQAFTNPELPLGADLDDVVEATRGALAAARGAGVPVLFTSIAYDEGMADAGVWARKQAGLLSLLRDAGATELDPRLERRPGEPIVEKKYASAFFGTDLVSRLNAARIDTVVLVGATTSGCVRATAVDAVQYGFVPIVVREAVGDRSLAAHDQSLFDLEQKYADVVSLDEACAELAGRAA
ncbi:MAG: isochorismatase family protein [Thermoleophilia bacterium]